MTCRNQGGSRRRVCLAAALAALLVVTALGDAWGRSTGGRYGGSSGFRRSPPALPGGSGLGRAPRDWGGPRYSRRYDWGGPRIFLPPLLFFGGGGGGLGIAGLLIVLGMGAFILYIVANDLRSRWGRTAAHPTVAYSIVTVQLALFATARFIQEELGQLARRGRTDTPEGLAALLRETTVALARKPEFWKYARVAIEKPQDLDEAEAAFRRAVGAERAKLSEELIVGVDDQRAERTWTPAREPALGEVAAYIVVTLVVAVSRWRFDDMPHPRQGDIEALLIKLGSVPAPRLLAFEVIWSPADPRDALTQEELLVEYTDLQPL